MLKTSPVKPFVFVNDICSPLIRVNCRAVFALALDLSRFSNVELVEVEPSRGSMALDRDHPWLKAGFSLAPDCLDVHVHKFSLTHHQTGCFILSISAGVLSDPRIPLASFIIEEFTKIEEQNPPPPTIL